MNPLGWLAVGFVLGFAVRELADHADSWVVEGWEDEGGFHEGRPPRREEDEPDVVRLRDYAEMDAHNHRPGA